MEKSSSRKTKKDKVYKPIPFLYRAFIFLFGLYLKVFLRLHIDRTAVKEIKPPYLLISNHQSFFDFGAAALICGRDLVDFVVTTHYFRDPVLRIGLILGGCIPKKQFYPDLAAVRRMIRVVREGRSIGIFPEGQTCFSGRNNEIDPDIGKLVKLLGIPVINVKIRGNFLAHPKYRHGESYPSYSEAKGELLLTKEDVETLSEAEIYEKISEALSYDEYEWQRAGMYRSKRPRSLQDIENVLWLCPKCGKEHTMQSEGPDLFCSSCGYRVHTDEYGFLLNADGSHADLDTPSKWSAWQESVLEEKLEEGTLLPYTLKGRFMISSLENYSEQGYGCHGEGTATIDKDGLTLDVIKDGEPFTYKTVPNLTFNLTHNSELWLFDVPGDKNEDFDYAFDPEDSRDAIKLIQTWSVIRRKYYS